MNIDNITCPVPILDYDTIQLAHGAGGKLTSELVEKLILPHFSNTILDKMEDQAIINVEQGKLSFTTDSYVVNPIFFPGGNIGDLALNGTINDLCMSGGNALYLSVGFIIEEGFPIEDFHKILLSMGKTAKETGIKIVAGDTKVVHKGVCDKIYINTSGIGTIPNDVNISASNLKVGDKIIVSGTIADHGMSIMTVREGFSFQNTIESDSAPLNELVKEMIQVCPDIHALRDPTRGGIAMSLNEWANQSNVGIQLYYDKIPVKDQVLGACEILGIDPIYVANEGKLLTAVSKGDCDKVLEVMKKNRYGLDAEIIGEVTEENAGLVVMKTALGVNRIVDMPLGDQLPRIC